jgi:NAD(P)-dependent dehydrogenase (short-subunit alcohol dehydrogenase family)
MAGQFDGKVVFITGAARGQGRSHALRFAQEGADMIAFELCDQIDSVAYPMATPEDLDETVNLVEKTGRRIVAGHGDVRDFERLKTAVANGVAELGRVDFVLANAGIMRRCRVRAGGGFARRPFGSVASSSRSAPQGRSTSQPEQRRPPTPSHRLSRHPRPGVLTPAGHPANSPRVNLFVRSNAKLFAF